MGDTDWLKQIDCHFLCPDSYKIILDFSLGAVFYLWGGILNFGKYIMYNFAISSLGA